MGQGFLPYDDLTPTAAPKKGGGFLPYDDTPKEQSWTDWGVTTGMRTVGGVGGSILGGIAGGLPGVVVGGGLGNAAGEAAAQWYEGNGYNPALIAVEGGMGAVPFVNKIPGMGAGAREVLKYAGKEALQGAALNAAGSVPRHMAETTGIYNEDGDLNLPSAERVATDAAGGALFGGLTGAVAGAGHVAYQNYKNPKLPPIQGPPFVSNTGPTTPPPPPSSPTPKWIDGEILNDGPTPGDPRPPSGGTGPIPNQTGPTEDVVTIREPSASTVAFYRNRGYVSVPGLVSPDGFPQMVRAEVAHLYTGGKRPSADPNFNGGEGDPMNAGSTPYAHAPEPPPQSGPLGFDDGDIPANDSVTVPNTQVTPTFIQNMMEAGYKLTQRVGNSSVFTKLIQDETGSLTIDPQDWKDIYQNLRRMLGRDPSAAELDTAVQRTKSEAEPSRGVAPFIDTKFRPNPEYTDWLNQEVVNERNNPPQITPELQQFAQDNPTLSGIRPPDVNSPEYWWNQRADAMERGNVPEASAAHDEWVGANHEQAVNNPPPPDPETLQGMIRMSSVMDRMNELRNTPRLITGNEQPIDLGQGQLELPWSRGMNDQPIDADARARQISQAMQAMQSPAMRQPVQQSMEGQMKDAEIAQYLRNEDARPPEMNDLVSRMEVPNSKQPGQLSNIAVGGADEPVLDMLATALYTRDRPATVLKELFQNAADEMKLSGQHAPIRIAIHHTTTMPNGTDAKSMTIRDYGRGMEPEQLYTIFTDVGKSGKRDAGDASGGFGFAKAAPLLGGEYVKVESTVRDSKTKKLIKYSFEGDPAQLKNQKKGVPLTREIITDPSEKTGFQVEVYFPKDKSFHSAEQLLQQTVENSPNMKNVQLLSEYTTEGLDRKGFLKEGTIGHTPYWDSTPHLKEFNSIPVPPRIDTIKLPTADVDVHYELDDIERKGTSVAYLNNGLFALEDTIGHGFVELPGIPQKMWLNIKSTVPEGSEGYPFGLNREELNKDVKKDISDWVRTNITNKARLQKSNEMQTIFDAIAPSPGNRHVIMDSGGRYTPDELDRLTKSPNMRKVADLMEIMLGELDMLFPDKGPGYNKQKGSTTKYGFQINDLEKGGMNLVNPRTTISDTNREFAVMINPLGLMATTSDPRIASQKLAHVILHEFNHNLIREEGGGFTWQLLETDSRYGTDRRSDIARAIQSAITGPDGNYAPEIQGLLQDYTAARRRPDTVPDLLSRQREGSFATAGERPGGDADDYRTSRSGPIAESVDVAKQGILSRLLTEEDGSLDVGTMWSNIKEKTGWGKGREGKPTDTDQLGFVKEMLALSSAATTTGDFSAPGRQGLTMVLTPQFWQALPKMFGAVSPSVYNKMENELSRRPIWTRKIRPDGKLAPSFGEEIGLKRFGTASNSPLNKRAESVASRWLETGGSIPYVSAAYRNTIGIPIRATNRAYIAFLNQLSTNRAEYLLRLAHDMSKVALKDGKVRTGIAPWKTSFSPAEALNLDPYRNKLLAKEIADYVNTATGHGPLRTHILPHKNAEASAESIAGFLSSALFSPGLMASRVRMLNPSTYVMATPQVRKEYIRSATSAAAAWLVATQMAKMVDDEVDVGTDILSADFGKIRIGEKRFDPGGGFSQFLVAYARLYQGKYASSSTGEQHEYGAGFQARTRKDAMETFMTNKLNPIAKFGYDIATATEYKPFHVVDRTLQLFVPLVVQDFIEIVADNPELLPWMAPVTMGMGTQTYDKGESVGKFIAPENDVLFEGGGSVTDLLTGNW